MKKHLLPVIVFVLFLNKLPAQRFSSTPIIKDTTSLMGVHQNMLLTNTTLLPADFYSSHLPFFCSKELQMQKITGVALKFRLGSIDYVNRLENKNAVISGLH